MSEATTQLLNDVLALPEDERSAFREALEEALSNDAGEDAELDAVLAKRMEDIRSGRVKPVPGEEFFRQLRERGA